MPQCQICSKEFSKNYINKHIGRVHGLQKKKTIRKKKKNARNIKKEEIQSGIVDYIANILI